MTSLPWTSELPPSWEIVPARAVLKPVRRDPCPKDETVTAFRDGQVTLRSNRRNDGFTESVKEIGYQGVRRGEVVIHSMDAFAGAIGVSDSDGKMSPVVHIYTAPNDSPEFIVHSLRATSRAGFIRALAKGIRERSTSFDRPVLKSMLLPRPPREEQDQIVAYLDRETQKIDELITEQRGLIEALRERWTGKSERVFGKYVAGNSRLRWFLEDIDQRAGEKSRELPLFSVSIDWGVRRRSSDVKQVEGDLSRYKVARRGDIVLNRMRAFQGALGVAPEDGLVSPDYSVLRTTNELNSEWLSLVMRSPAFVGKMVSRIRGIGGVTSGAVRTPRLNFTDLREISIGIPDRDRQSRDLSVISHEASRIDELISESEDLIALSQERRAALITAAVTGQIDVRAAS